MEPYRIRIRSIADLDSFPQATVRPCYLSEDSLGSADVRLAVLRVISTWSQEEHDGVGPQEPGRLPALLETALAGLAAESLELWGAVREPGVGHIGMNFLQLDYTKVMDATMVVIRFSVEKADATG